MAEHTFKIKYKLTNGDEGTAGTFSLYDGEDGSAATIEIGEVVTLEPGAQAYVENVGTNTHAVLNIGIPAGAKGEQGEQGPAGADGKNAEITLNGVNVTDPAFYAPIGSGESGQTVESRGEGNNPQWVYPAISTLNGSTPSGAAIYAPTGSGNAGQILQSNGENAIPTWVDNSGGGGGSSQVYDSRGIIGTYDETSRTATINGVSYLLSETDDTCAFSGFNAENNDGTLELFFICVYGHYYTVKSVNTILQANDTIKTVIIKSPLTNMQSNFLNQCTALMALIIAAPIEAGDRFLQEATSLLSVTIAAPMDVGSYSFYGCTALKTIFISTLGEIYGSGSSVFGGCTALSDIYYIGTEEDAYKNISSHLANDFWNATWHYNATWPYLICS